MATTTLDYIARDFSSIQDALISYATVTFGANTQANRLWTSFNTSSFSRVWLEMLAYVTDLMMFYLDNQATEAYLQTASLQSSIQNIANQFGYTPATAASSSGLVDITSSASTSLSAGFRISDSSGNLYFLASSVSGSGSLAPTSVIQGINNTETFSAVGIQNEQFSLVGPNVIIDSTTPNTSFISPQVTVNGNNYTLVNSLLRFNGSDSPRYRFFRRSIRRRR